MLSTSLRGVVSQQLVPRKGEPGLVAALEIMVNTPAVSNLIRQGKLDQLETAMQAGGRVGMRTMDSALKDLLDQGRITGQAAWEAALDKRKFESVKDLVN
jgi:twitching motility protein PilT